MPPIKLEPIESTSDLWSQYTRYNGYLGSSIWAARRILAEASNGYLIEWDGINPATNNPWTPSWILTPQHLDKRLHSEYALFSSSFSNAFIPFPADLTSPTELRIVSETPTSFLIAYEGESNRVTGGKEVYGGYVDKEDAAISSAIRLSWHRKKQRNVKGKSIKEENGIISNKHFIPAFANEFKTVGVMEWSGPAIIVKEEDLMDHTIQVGNETYIKAENGQMAYRIVGETQALYLMEIVSLDNPDAMTRRRWWAKSHDTHECCLSYQAKRVWEQLKRIGKVAVSETRPGHHLEECVGAVLDGVCGKDDIIVANAGFEKDESEVVALMASHLKVIIVAASVGVNKRKLVDNSDAEGSKRVKVERDDD